MSQFALHPESFADLDEIRQYIANDNPDAADRLMDEFFAEFENSCQIFATRPCEAGTLVQSNPFPRPA